jgi:hypothetical protein
VGAPMKADNADKKHREFICGPSRFFHILQPLAILSIISDKCRRRHAWEISTDKPASRHDSLADAAPDNTLFDGVCRY